MANFPSYTLKDFKSSQNLIARDPAGSGTLIRVNGQSILDSAVAEILAQDGLLQAIDTLTEAVATDYSSGVYVLVGGEVAVLDGGTALYRVSDAGSGGTVMDNGNELVALIVSLIEAAELTAQAAASAEEAAASELAVSTNAAQVAIDADLAQTAASEAATSAATYDNFDQLYLGSKATAPALDNEGNALISGAEYFDTTLNAKYTWNGSAWVATNATGLGTASLVDIGTGDTQVPTNGDLRPTVTGYVSSVAEYLSTVALSSIEIGLTLGNGDFYLPSSTFESIGPVGSGADNEWSGLDDLPAGSKYVKLLVRSFSADTASATSAISSYFRVTGSTTSFTECQRVYSYVNSWSTGSGIGSTTSVSVPVDSLNRFDIRWSGAVDENDSNITIQVVGFGV